MSSDRLIVEVHGIPAGVLSRDAERYTFKYLTGYHGPSVSLTMPVRDQSYAFTDLPHFLMDFCRKVSGWRASCDHES